MRRTTNMISLGALCFNLFPSIFVNRFLNSCNVPIRISFYIHVKKITSNLGRVDASASPVWSWSCRCIFATRTAYAGCRGGARSDNRVCTPGITMNVCGTGASFMAVKLSMEVVKICSKISCFLHIPLKIFWYPSRQRHITDVLSVIYRPLSQQFTAPLYQNTVLMRIKGKNEGNREGGRKERNKFPKIRNK